MLKPSTTVQVSQCRAKARKCRAKWRPKVKHCSTLHDRAPMVHDRAKFQNFYKFSFSPHLKGLDFLEQNSLLSRFLRAFQRRF
ncbi:hypothetical protein E3N88_00161 [Mikania micrantha]|uniref:Uncharacterized protein n=1 Tax=Mikania micrantha TaxID=192012 RepID=A0A5N6PX95_9ASTR|nr:hypothetical protein E3N88_00161 [Mikania micrantha]